MYAAWWRTLTGYQVKALQRSGISVTTFGNLEPLLSEFFIARYGPERRLGLLMEGHFPEPKERVFYSTLLLPVILSLFLALPR
jgi:hypothetical protein